ncbi:MAG TPA: amidohydrolase family protein, partial [Ferruginibacter sp.]|nr:amidohydrolase family protein [Ferruginibacter sp.]
MHKFFLIGFILLANAACAQQKIDFESYNPPSTLVVPQHLLTRAKFPFIDVHNHQYRMPTMDLNTLTTEMDKLNMRVMVNLSGGSGNQLKEAAKNAAQNKPGRFIVFANVDFKNVGEPGWGEKAANQLLEDVKNGANGLKIFKSLGFSVKDINGNRVPVDDARLDALWEKAAELKIPVLIHTADPKSFWDPLDSTNERWLELIINPNRKRGADNPVPFETLIAEQHRLFKKHRNTTFIAAHFGWYPNDLNK